MKECSNQQIAERLVELDKEQLNLWHDGIIDPSLLKRKSNLINIGLRKGFVESVGLPLKRINCHYGQS